MTNVEAIEVLKRLVAYDSDVAEAKRVAIKALQFVEHFDLLKEYQSLQETVKCEDCKWEFICRQTVEQVNGDEVEHRPLEWCSYGEHRIWIGGDSE